MFRFKKEMHLFWRATATLPSLPFSSFKHLSSVKAISLHDIDVNNIVILFLKYGLLFDFAETN